MVEFNNDGRTHSKGPDKSVEESWDPGQAGIMSLHTNNNFAPDAGGTKRRVLVDTQEPGTAGRDDGSQNTLATLLLESTSNAPISTLLSFDSLDEALSHGITLAQ